MPNTRPKTKKKFEDRKIALRRIIEKEILESGLSYAQALAVLSRVLGSTFGHAVAHDKSVDIHNDKQVEQAFEFTLENLVRPEINAVLTNIKQQEK